MKLNPKIVVCSETCMTEAIEDTEAQMKGYKVLRCDSVSRHTGGVVIYVKDNIRTTVLLNESVDKNAWFLTIKVYHKFISGIITAVYHSPNSSHAKFIDCLASVIDRTYDPSKLNIVIGDFNIDMNSRLIRELGMKQLMKQPTRVTERSRTIIDLVISNEKNIQ